MEFHILKSNTELPKYYKGYEFNPELPISDSNYELIIDGPPYANGDVHLGHLLNKTIKDTINRRNYSKGLYSKFVAGWDCHGLPIELKVKRSENPLITRTKCRTLALNTVNNHKETLNKLGINYSDTYRTLDNEFQVYELELLKTLFDKNLIYRGNKPTYWSIKNRTALAESEVIYKDVEVNTAYCLFRTTSSLYSNLNLIAWTTTPWTLLGNKALAVNSSIEYYLFFKEGSYYLSNKTFYLEFKSLYGEVELITTLLGSELVNLFPTYTNLNGETCPILEVNSLVEDNKGTGIVHINPSHGFEDYEVGLKYNLQVKDLFHTNGAFIYYQDNKYSPEELSEFLILNEPSILHSSKQVIRTFYDERTSNPVYIRPTAQWFFDISSIKEKVIKELDKVEFYPSQGKKALANTIDSRSEWCISRQRVWGIPIPYVVDKEGNTHIVIDRFLNKIEEYKDVVEDYTDLWWDLDIEELTDIPNCKKGNDVLDVWFDSGCIYLYQTKDLEEVPNTVFIEGIDQYRGWFQSSCLITYAIKEVLPFSKLLVHGFTLDQYGNKMSKSKGNGVNPKELLKTYSLDILRLLVLNQDFTKDIALSEDTETQMVSLYNNFRGSISFILGSLYDYESLEEYKPSVYTPLDQYIINQFNEELTKCNAYYEQYSFHLVIQSLQELRKVMSVFINLSKDRLYIDAQNSNERKGCQYVINYLLSRFLYVLEPICPSLASESRSSSKVLVNTSSVQLEIPNEQIYDFSSLDFISEIINKHFEELKKAKLCGSKLDLEVLIPSSLISLEAINTRLIACYLGLSDLSITKEGEVEIKVSTKHKCNRCWNRTSLSYNLADSILCNRCYELETSFS